MIEPIKSNMKYFIKIITISLLFSSITEVFSQNKLNLFQSNCESLLQNKGQWRTYNKNHNPNEEWSVSYYGYFYEKGINNQTLKLSIKGYIPSKSEWFTFWDGFYFFDNSTNKINYYSTSNNGNFIKGTSEKFSSNEIELLYTIHDKNGIEKKQKEIQTFSNNEIISKSYTYEDKKWKLNEDKIWVKNEIPDGDIIFMSTRDGNFEVYQMNINSGHAKNLTCNKTTDYSFSNFKNGDLLFYSNRDGNDEIYRLDKDGKKFTNLTNNPAGDRIADISPDESKIVFTSDRNNKNKDIFIMNSDGTNIISLTNDVNFEDAPSFSPDGNKIIFTKDIITNTDETAYSSSNGEIFIMNIDGSNITRLTNREGFDGGAQFSPDGSKIAFYGKTEKGNYEIFLMNPDGTNIENLTNDELEDYSPSWSPDGNWIAYTKGNSENYDVWVINLKTKIKHRLTTQPKRDESPYWKN